MKAEGTRISIARHLMLNLKLNFMLHPSAFNLPPSSFGKRNKNFFQRGSKVAH